MSHFGEPLHLQALGSFQKGGQLTVLEVHLAPIHKLNERAQLSETHVLQDDDRMPVRMVNEQTLKVRGAGGQDDFVRAYRMSL